MACCSWGQRLCSWPVSLFVWVANVLLASGAGSQHALAAKRVYVSNDSFMMDGEPLIIRSGSLHYFRVPPAYWRDRIQRLKALGLNTITAYVAWNFHEEVEGVIRDFDMIGTFLDLLHEEGMMVIFRPGPYICGEWEFGGLPSWLLAKPGIKIRTYNAPYLDAVNRWLHKLYASTGSKAYSKGGPIIALQIENEYGSYGDCVRKPDDAKYMEHLYDLAHSYFGTDIVYTTVDSSEQTNDWALMMGTPWENNSKVVATIDGFVSTNYDWNFYQQKQFNAPGNSVKMYSELWVGWYNFWGDAYKVTLSAFTPTHVKTYWNIIEYQLPSLKDGLKLLMDDNASFSLYMAHGGTNFGFWSGAGGDPTQNGVDSFMPYLTSYDYAAPISEAGDHNIDYDGGDIFLAIQEAISSKVGKPLPKEPASIPKAAYGKIVLTKSAHLFANLDKLQTCSHTVRENTSFPTFEDLVQPSGFVLYSRTPGLDVTSFSEQTLHFNASKIHDRMQIFVDGSFIGSAYRREGNWKDGDISFHIPGGENMSLLVENMGRINYGRDQIDYKGLLMKPPVEGNWTASCLPFGSTTVQGLPFDNITKLIDGEPVFRRGALEIKSTPKDTFLDTGGLTKGVIWVNGHNLGRFWATKGPQYTLYVPAPYLRTGENEVIVLDLEGSTAEAIVSVAEPRFAYAPAPTPAPAPAPAPYPWGPAAMIVLTVFIAAAVCCCWFRRHSCWRRCSAKVLVGKDDIKSHTAKLLREENQPIS